MTRYCIKIVGPRKQLSILPSPSIMLERGTSLAEQPFNGESMGSQGKATLFLLLLLLPIVVQGSVQRRIVAHWRSGQEE